MGRVEYLVQNVSAVGTKQFGHSGKLVDAAIVNIPFYSQGDEVFFSTDVLHIKATEDDPTEIALRMLYFRKSKSHTDDIMPPGIYLETFAKYEDFDQKFQRRLTAHFAEQFMESDFTQDDLQLKPYGMTEKHQLLILSLSLNHNSNRNIFKELFSGNPEKHTTVDYKNVKITNKEGFSLCGFLAGTSIAIPTHTHNNSEKFIQNAVDANWETFLSMKEEKEAHALFRFLNTQKNTIKNGFHTTETKIEHARFIHIYPHMHFETQEDFVEALTKSYNNEGFTISIETPPR